MSKRKKILNKLINFEASIVDLKKYLNSFSWDSDKELVILEKRYLERLFHKFLKGEIKEDALEEWANLIEGRDDIGFESDDIENIIYKLANPVLYGRNDIDKIKNYLKKWKET